MKQEVIKELSAKELQEKLILERGNLVKLKLNHAVSPIENPLKINHARKTVARLKTEIRKRTLAGTL
ncbi:MAG: 50S ribosomal protein L29 [Bacteroidetes bacterium]|jgi:large subunit ribosomal protein L29|nr:50S ribosomal protein L29 [Bacteroidota bacterium]MBP6413321.1 50S ribosomal protein L29 [Bacteroidia bacterium]MBK9672053.1 50S ribosomal protein L29 [Bacteroidota bacterium]MBK9800471.1 50S ribosomal protein L29 [Bacteroidota bacterium]HRH01250.1 50S ribosomal protein L29 [Bacteroidia bacterium]